MPNCTSVACLREGAQRFGWVGRDPTPRARREGRWLVGTGVASGTYPVFRLPGSKARIRYEENGCYVVEIGATDIGTGTALTQIAADALEVRVENIDLRIGDTELPFASVAGGSSGITAWGSTIFGAARTFRGRHGQNPAAGDTAEAGMPDNPDTENYSMHAFGAYFAEYHIPTNADVGEMDVAWIDEHDPHVNPMGSKGIGEIGICGSPAAIANAVYHATGARVRDLPITPDKLLR